MSRRADVPEPAAERRATQSQDPTRSVGVPKRTAHDSLRSSSAWVCSGRVNRGGLLFASAFASVDQEQERG
jgi:hypothetical protein